MRIMVPIAKSFLEKNSMFQIPFNITIAWARALSMRRTVFIIRPRTRSSKNIKIFGSIVDLPILLPLNSLDKKNQVQKHLSYSPHEFFMPCDTSSSGGDKPRSLILTRH